MPEPRIPAVNFRAPSDLSPILYLVFVDDLPFDHLPL